MFYRCVDSFPVLPPYTGPPVSYRAAQVQCQRPAPPLWQHAQICPIKSSGDTAASYGIPLILQDNNVSMNFKRTLTLWPFTICAYPKGTRELRPRASEISPLYNFLPSEGWSREAGRLCFFCCFYESDRLTLTPVSCREFTRCAEVRVWAPRSGGHGMWLGAFSPALEWSTTLRYLYFSVSIFWGFERPLQENVLLFLLHCIYFDTFFVMIAWCIRAKTATFLIHFFYCHWNHQRRKTQNSDADNQKNAECQIWCS